MATKRTNVGVRSIYISTPDVKANVIMRDSNVLNLAILLETARACKESVFVVILVCIQSECGKIRARITPNADTFYAVSYVCLNNYV